jgi:hypothetical protein
MIPCKFYDPTSLRSSDLVKEWKFSQDGKVEKKVTAKREESEEVLWFLPKSPNDQKSHLSHGLAMYILLE